ncbi:MAG: PAS domain-containing protein, partial [Thermodesulfobacteriota bacterium]
HELIWDREKPCDKCPTFDVFDTKEPLEWISVHPERDNVYQVYDYPFIDTDGTLLVLGLSIDITERKRAEEALAIHTKRLDRLSELSMTLSGDPGEVFESVVRMIAELLDVRVVCLSEIRGDELYFLSVYADGKTFADAGHCPLEVTPCSTVEEGKDLRVYDHVIEKFPKAAFLKEYKAHSYCGFPSLDNNGNVVAVTCLIDDKPHEFSEEDQRLLRVFGQRIAMELDRNKVIAEKMKSEALLQNILDNSTTVVYVKDSEGKYLLINSIYERLFHIDRKDIIGMTDFDIFSKDMAEAFRTNDLKVLETGEPMEFEEIVPHDEGDHTYLSVKFPLNDNDNNPYAVCGISTDITERTRMEADRLKMQKLESIGVLAGGIAHDFNNLLTAILGNISLSIMGLDPDDKTLKRLKEAERASLFARDLTQQLLTFAKGGAPIMETLPIDELIREPAELALRGSNKSSVFKIPSGLPSVEADKGQIAQVINNLVINADQAMPIGGVILISAEKVSIDTNTHLPLKKGGYILIRVADEGTGISPEHLSKVFDPYFTTKQKGSGLGLASAYSIIKNHMGHIDLKSTVGKGTTFKIYLPVSHKKAAPSNNKESELIRGSGRVLIMDDEEIIRALLSDFLTQLGYEPESASDGLEAINIYKEAKGAGRPFKATIMDLTIQGGVGGKEAIKLLLEEEPKARVIVSSGYSNDPVVANYREHGFSGYLNKPYKILMLSKV